jgi:hypothetical protein
MVDRWKKPGRARRALAVLARFGRIIALGLVSVNDYRATALDETRISAMMGVD